MKLSELFAVTTFRFKPVTAFSLSYFPLAFLLFLSVVFTASCSSQELTSEKAQTIITESNEFKQPTVLELIQLYIKDGDGVTEAKSDNEPEIEAAQRRIQEYYYEAPQVAVADHFGLAKPVLKRKSDKPEYPSSLRGYWHFDERYVITEKGKQMWEDLRFPVNETAVPLAQPVFLEITGITKQGENNATAEFKWKWNPNEIGKALDASTEEYKNLPENLKRILTEPNTYTSQERLKSWGGERSGKAMFQKYDDGWRLTSLGLF